MRLNRLLACLVLSLFVAPSLVAADFVDLDEFHPNRVAILELEAQGVVQGYADESFKPWNEVNRAEALKIILEAFDIEVPESELTLPSYEDVDSEAWYAVYVQEATLLGIVSGYPDAKFRPEQTVNRAELMKMLSVAASLGVREGDDENWYIPFQNFALEQNVIPLQVDGSWHPEQALTRGEVAEAVYRLQQYTETIEPFDEAQNWLTQDFPTVGLRFKVPFAWHYKGEGVGAIWLHDYANGQLSLLDPGPNGATLLITKIPSQVSVPDKNPASGRQVQNGIVLHEISSANDIFREWHLSLPNGDWIHLKAWTGEGPYTERAEELLLMVMESVDLMQEGGSPSLEEAITALNQAIQVDGQGQAAMDGLDDWVLLETDPIGIGTGPIDYYTSPSANLTVKYERSFDVILAIREGSTTAF